MNIVEQLDEFIRENETDVFIEVEGRPSALHKFYEDYNRHYNPTIDDDTDGVIALDDSADKWGLELRLYMHENPDFLNTTKNTVYRPEYAYRINDVDIIQGLFYLGYRIGLNQSF